MVLKAKELSFMEGVKVGKDDVDISHLQFADDALLFCPARK